MSFLLRHVALLSLSLAGCVSVDIDSHVRSPDDGVPLRSIFILDGAEKPEYKQAIAPVGDALATALHRCGMRAQSYTLDSMVLNNTQMAREAFKRFEPDAMLLVRLTFVLISGGGLRVTYLLALEDVKKPHDIWKAQIDYAPGDALVVDLSKSADTFASRVTDQMVKDKVLQSCPELTVAAR